MKTKLILLALAALAAGSLHAQNKVTVAVDGLENQKGTIMLALFAKEGFLQKPVATAMGEATPGATLCLENIPDGAYAIALFVSESSQAPDFSQGMPKGSYGLSGMSDFTQGPPTFEKCGFRVAADTTVRITAHPMPFLGKP